ncbi:MAG TPA: M14 metallopeptidase family protein [Thermoanaerobaculia bacterium]|nr:M14 metallopeptidase family protein [Thermoanaerobaculia bacterium]
MLRIRSVILSLAILALPSLSAAADVPAPETFLGHRVGEDRKLAPWPKVVEYLRLVDAASDRVSIESAGTSTLGKDMPVVVLTSAANQANLERYREIARRLANPDGLSEEQARALAAEGKTIALVTCSIHSTEVGSTQMAMEFVHDVATTRDPEMLAWIDDVIFLLMPSINPDGQVLVIDWYNKQLGTPFEGGRMPWLYHHYVGHDNNRDFYMLTQKESQAVNQVLYHRWYPQIFLDEHQMGATGPRMFVPPQADPLAPEVHSLIFRMADLLGTVMSMRLEEGGKLGVGSNMIYDSYWPGGTRNTAWWKNVTGLLTEVASADIGTPIYIEPGELRGGVKGLPEYDRRSNFPSPWPGGWWRVRDIVEYELIATRAFLEAGAEYRESILFNLFRMAREATERGASEPPYAWIVPAEQRDPVAAARLIELLLRHGVRVQRAAASVTVGRAVYPAGTYVIPAAQPYRAFLLTMLRPQRYPEVIPYEGGPIMAPYDVTSWSLPIAMSVEVDEAERPIAGIASSLAVVSEPVWPGGDVAAAPGGHVISHAADSAFAALNHLTAGGKKVFWLERPADEEGLAGDFYLPAGSITPEELSRLSRELHLPVRPLDQAPTGPAFRVKPVRVGLYKPWVASMDEGWTRFLLERYGFRFENLVNEQMKTGAYKGKVDVILFPAVGKDILEKGEPSSAEARRFWDPLPPPYAGGIGSDGGEKLKKWVEDGGTLVALDESADYVIDLLGLPVTNVLAKVSPDLFNCPGSMLRIRLDPAHPLSHGLQAEEAAYFADSPAFQTSPPDARFERRVVASYPENEKDILVSGYLKGGERLEKRAAVVDFKVGKGRVVLIGFRAQHRAQPHRTFKLLWNALYLAGLEKTEL